MASNPKPTDVTGRARAKQTAEAAEQLQARASEMSMATATAQIKLDEVIDYTQPNVATVIVDEPTVVAGANEETVAIRVVEDIENMTLGVGNFYSFKAGQKYLVSKHVAQHLQEKGYLAGVI